VLLEVATLMLLKCFDEEDEEEGEGEVTELVRKKQNLGNRNLGS